MLQAKELLPTKIKAYRKQCLDRFKAPMVVDFVSVLPKIMTGKIRENVLRDMLR